MHYRSGVSVSGVPPSGTPRTSRSTGACRSRRRRSSRSTPERRLKNAVAELNARADVAYAELDAYVRADSLPNDARFAELWGLNNTGQTGGTDDADIDAPEACVTATRSATPT